VTDQENKTQLSDEGNKEGGSSNGDSLLSSTQDAVAEDMQTIARSAARLRVMETMPYETLAHGTKLYLVDKGWESSIIEDDPKVARVTNLRQFESALQDADVKTIYIPNDALVTQSQLETICKRNASTKVIYKEGKEQNNV